MSATANNSNEINLDLMMPMLKTVLTSTRNYNADPDLRLDVSQYLFYKLWNMGIPTAYQALQPNRFYEQVQSPKSGIVDYCQCFQITDSSHKLDITFQIHLQEGQTLNDVQGYNFVGLLPGKNWGTPKDEIVVLGAVISHLLLPY